MDAVWVGSGLIVAQGVVVGAILWKHRRWGQFAAKMQAHEDAVAQATASQIVILKLQSAVLDDMQAVVKQVKKLKEAS